MKNKTILPIEEDRRDKALSLSAFHKGDIVNEIITARDGSENLDYRFKSGHRAARHMTVQRQLILLYLKLPKINGLQFFAENTRRSARQAVIFLYIHVFARFSEAARQQEVYWLLLNWLISNE